MLNPESFVKLPEGAQTEKNIPATPLPIDAERATELIEKRVELIVRSIQRPPHHFFRHPHQDLFTISASDQGFIKGSRHDHPGFEMPKQELQNAAFRVMERFGINGSNFTERRFSNDTRGTITQFRVYKSTTVPGLQFERTLEQITDNGDPVSVHWDVSEEMPEAKSQEEKPPRRIRLRRRK